MAETVDFISGRHLGGPSTIFPIPIYTNGIDNFDAIQYEIDKAAEKVNFNMRPDWGHTHYLSDITFKENFIEKYKLTKFKKELTWHVNQYHQNKNFSIESSWMTVFKKYNYGHIHDHGGNDISGVYYFKTNSQDGNFFFESPYPLDDTRVQIGPQPGMIVLFPSWLRHGIQTNLTDNVRMSLSFNIKLAKESEL